MTTKGKRYRAKILKELVVKKEFDHGPHPQKYSRRFFRKRTRPFRNEHLRRPRPKSLTDVLDAHANRLRSRPNHSIFRKESITPMEQMEDLQMYEAIQETFRANRLLEETEPVQPTTIGFLRLGWRSYYAPSGLRIPVTPKCKIVPLGYFTFRETKARARAKRRAKRKVKPEKPVVGVKRVKKFIKFLWRWFMQYIRYNPRHFVLRFARLSDFDENECMDRTKKNYQYFRLGGFPPYFKRKVPNFYDGCMYCLYAKYINLRRYSKYFASKYRYKPTYAMNKRSFKVWRSNRPYEKLRKTFIRRDKKLTGFISFKEMCKILDKRGNKTLVGVRKKEFDWFVKLGLKTKLTPKGQIEFEEFLRVWSNIKYDFQFF